MHLNECLSLIFPSPLSDKFDVDANQELFANYAFSDELNNEKDHTTQFQQGSLLSMMKCIGSDWAFKTQTNFYIPAEYYAGYTYLYSENEHHLNHQHIHGHHHHQYTFVRAHTPSNLHVHHYQPHPLMSYTMHSSNSSFNDLVESAHATNTTVAQKVLSQANPIHVHSHNQNPNHHLSYPPAMTIPYHHPELQLPVPPLHLPWYFAALCFSFTLGGIFMLIVTPSWVEYGGGYHSKTNKCKRHWYPYRVFAWMLILLQGPSSFLADYVHMTNVSIWHVLDRILASFCMSLELLKVITMFPYTRTSTYIFYSIGVAVSVFCFMKSQECQVKLDAEGFVFWHCGWHCQPLIGIIVFSRDYFMNKQWGDYYDVSLFKGEAREEGGVDECKDEGTEQETLHKRGELGGVLLSSIAMDCAEQALSQNKSEDKTAQGDNATISTTKTLKRRVKSTNSNVMATPVRRSRRIAEKMAR